MPLPESNTKRYWLVYTVGPQEHRIMSRVADSVGDGDALAELFAFASAVQVGWGTNVTATALEVAEKGSNVRNLVDGWTPVVGLKDGPIAAIQFPREASISGRSRTGHKTRISIFGLNMNTPDTWEEDPIASDGLVDVQPLLGTTVGFWLAIDGQPSVWYTRATFNYNDHFVVEARG